jgi:ABC-type uncharacterized transport system substrate-binding protein
MRRRAFLYGSVLTLATPLGAEGQPATPTRIGVLSPGSDEPSPWLDAFRQSLRDSGHHEGKNILIEYRFAEGRPERLPDIAGELVRLNVDVIVAINTPASQAAKAATSDPDRLYVGGRSPRPGRQPGPTGGETSPV